MSETSESADKAPGAPTPEKTAPAGKVENPVTPEITSKVIPRELRGIKNAEEETSMMTEARQTELTRTRSGIPIRKSSCPPSMVITKAEWDAAYEKTKKKFPPLPSKVIFPAS